MKGRRTIGSKTVCGRAFWGAPISNLRHARDACPAALTVCRRMAPRHAQIPAGASRADLRGRGRVNMSLGNIGSADRLRYTVPDDPVNVASWLLSLN